MSKNLLYFSLALAFSLAPVPPARAADQAAADLPPDLPRELPPLGKDRPLPVPSIKQIKTPEGLNVWLVKRGGVPKVSAVLAVRGGMASDPQGMEGISDVLAEVLKDGTRKRSARQIAEEIQALGGELETSAGADAILLSAHALGSGTAALLELLSDIARNATFPDEEVTLARQNALQDLLVKESTPEFLGSKVFARAIYGDHPYHVVAATREVLDAIRPDLLRREFARRFRPESSLLVLVGNFGLAAAEQAVKKSFGGWQGSGAAPPPMQPQPPAPPAGAGKKLLITNRPGSVQSLIMVGRPALKATDPEYYPLLVANTVFGGSFGSRLVKNIREDKGYTYSPRVELRTQRLAGLLRVRCDVRTDVTAATLKEIFREMERMGSDPPSADELARARRYQSGLYLLRNQIQSAVAGTLASNWIKDQGPEALTEFVPRVNAVTSAQVQTVSRSIYQPDAETVVVVGDEPKIKAALAPFAAAPARQPSSSSSSPSSSSSASAGASPAATPLLLPGAPGPVAMDYLAYDPATARLWVPAGNTGRVDVLDTRTGKLASIEGFATAKRTTPRGERTLGPSSATVGAGTVYVGNRADSQVCAVDGRTLSRGGCATLPGSPDGLAYVAATREVWVTTPHDRSISILDVRRPAAPALAGKLALPGEPEGYAADAERGLFYTNLEDKDLTLVIDARARKVTATWRPGCGEAGPRGLALDAAHHLLLVACTDKVVALATDRDGAVRGQVQTGGGVDNIDFDAARRLLYAASGKTATLTIARVEGSGALSKLFAVPTADGARSVVLDGAGKAYVIDSARGRLLVLTPPK